MGDIFAQQILILDESIKSEVGILVSKLQKRDMSRKFATKGGYFGGKSDILVLVLIL